MSNIIEFEKNRMTGRHRWRRKISKTAENDKQRLRTVPILVSQLVLYFKLLIMMAMSNIVDFEKN
ncbi:hypothetical protein DD595_25215, partial [Enterobacter cloacae complex sp. 4DZ3-17B2]|uniref:hypothetical protein n=1 Tax=Enterobacter cloacae complex sp. 4DZ3-17B2 TaxID=2511990 RepID=UPI0010262D85